MLGERGGGKDLFLGVLLIAQKLRLIEEIKATIFSSQLIFVRICYSFRDVSVFRFIRKLTESKLYYLQKNCYVVFIYSIVKYEFISV